MSLVSVSIVLYKNKREALKTIVDTLNSSIPISLFLIDNSPTNQLQHDLAEIISDERVTYIFNNNNIGYGAGHNVALRQIQNKSSYHLVLNPDVRFQSDVLANMVAYADKCSDVGVMTPKVYYPDGTVQHVCKLLPTPFDLIFRRFFPASWHSKRTAKFELHPFAHDRIFEAPYIHGCFMFLRTSALQKVGLFDERFFMYPEDIDLTRRMHQQFKTIYFPHVSIVHEHGRGSYKSLRLLRIHIVNMIKYFNKWGWFFDKERKAVNQKILSQFDQ